MPGTISGALRPIKVASSVGVVSATLQFMSLLCVHIGLFNGIVLWLPPLEVIMFFRPTSSALQFLALIPVWQAFQKQLIFVVTLTWVLHFSGVLLQPEKIFICMTLCTCFLVRHLISLVRNLCRVSGLGVGVCVGGGAWGETGRMGSKTGSFLACTRSALGLPVLDRTHAYKTFARAGCSGSLVGVAQFPLLVRGFGGVPFWSPHASAWAALAPLPHSYFAPLPYLELVRDSHRAAMSPHWLLMN